MKKALPALLVLWLVGLLAGTAWLAYTWHDTEQMADRDLAGDQAREAATRAMEELFSYEAGGLGDDLEAERGLLTDDFADDYLQMVTDNVLPEATRTGLAAQAQVVSDGLVAAGTDRVECLVFVNIAATGKKSQSAQPRGSRLLVTMREQDGDWLVDGIRAV